MTLGEVRTGGIIEIGGREYIVLNHGTSSTAVLARHCVCDMEFGEDNDYRQSGVRRYLNSTFYNELLGSLSATDIVDQLVHLETDDGTNKNDSCIDHVGLLTTTLYRRFRQHIPAGERAWWLATPKSKAEGWTRNVCCVSDGGVPFWNESDWSRGVRPFIFLNSSILNFTEVQP